jgi:hypothetical protein
MLIDRLELRLAKDEEWYSVGGQVWYKNSALEPVHFARQGGMW